MKQSQPKSGFSLSSLSSVVIIVSLLIALVVLFQKINSLNEVIVALDEKVYKLSSGGSSAVKATQQLPTAASWTPSTTQQQTPKRRTMKEIGTSTTTDKILTHGYDRFYPYFLEHLRDVPGMKMLEIGYNLGFSYQMWLEYFPQGKVYFMEKDHGVKFPEARFTGDQSKMADLSRLLKTKGLEGDLDFIIDDGSHHPEHQMISFTYLFQYGLKPGGIYIIEDTETSYWRSGDTYGLPTLYGKDSPNSAINRLKALIDVVNRRYEPADEPFQSTFGKAIDENVQSIYFGPNFVIITKITPEERPKYDSSTYMWKDKLEKPKKNA